MNEPSAERQTIRAADGYPLSVWRYGTTDNKRPAIVIAPAMGVPQTFYAPFARHLAAQGFAVWAFDYRGIGESLHGSLRNVKASISDWVSKDYESVIKAALGAEAHSQVLIIGHSLGGQTAPLLPSSSRIAGLVNIAVGSGAMRHNTPPVRFKARFLWGFIAPLLCKLFGYFPGGRIGMIGNIPAGAMMQWRKWCLTPDYLLTGEPGARAAYAGADYPVLALTFSDDELLMESGSKLIHDAYNPAHVDYRVIQPSDVDASRIGHFGFFKPLFRDSLWTQVSSWLETRAHSHSR